MKASLSKVFSRLQTDRFDARIQLLVTILFVLILGVPFIAFGYLVLSYCQQAEKTPETRFSEFFAVDEAGYKVLNHSEFSGFDFSHYFEFEFKELNDIEVIIRQRKLSEVDSGVRQSSSGPDWYAPDFEDVCFQYFEADQQIVLWVNFETRHAFFEFHKF